MKRIISRRRKQDLRRRNAARYKPLVEQLEDRRLLAVEMGYQVFIVPADAPLFEPVDFATVDPRGFREIDRDPLTAGIQPSLPFVNIGQSFDMVVTVALAPTAVTGNGQGVFEGYLDLGYNSSKARLQAAEIQRISLGPTPIDVTTPASTFQLTFGPQTTAPIQYSSNASTMATRIGAALRALTSIGGTLNEHVEVQSVTQPNDPTKQEFLVFFRGKFLGQDVHNMQLAGENLTGPGNPTVTIGYEGDLAAPEIPDIALREAFRSRGVRTVTGIDPPIFYFNGLNAGQVINANSALSFFDDVGAFGSGNSPFPGQTTSAEDAAGLQQAPPRELVRARFVASGAGPLTFTPSIQNYVATPSTTLGDLLTPSHITSINGRNTALNLDEIAPRQAVSLEVRAIPAVEYQLRVVQAGGALFIQDPANPVRTIPTPDLTAVQIDSFYDLVLTAQDLRPGTGVASAFIDIDLDLTGGATTTVQAPEIQRIDIGPRPLAGGTFALTFGSLTTGNISVTANPDGTGTVSSANTIANRIRAELENLGTPGPGDVIAPGDVLVTADADSDPTKFQFFVRFQGRLLGQGQPNMTIAGLNTAGASVAVFPEGDIVGGVPGAFAFKEAFRSQGLSTIQGVPAKIYYPTQLNAGNGIPGDANFFDDVGAVGDPNPPLPGDLFETPATGDIDEGSIGLETPPAREVARVRLRAGSAQGSITFTPEMLNLVLPAHQTLLFGRNEQVLYDANPTFSEIRLGALGDPNDGAKTLQVVNDPILVVNDNDAINEDFGPRTIDVLANDTAAGGGNKSVVNVGAVSPAGAGNVVNNGTNVTFTPAQDFFGTASFTYTAENTTIGGQQTGNVVVTVNSVNDEPDLTAPATHTINEDPIPALQTINLTGIGAGALNEGQTLTITAVSDNQTLIDNTAITVNYSGGATGTLQYTPASNGFGTANITITVNDGGGIANGGDETLTHVIAVTVNAVNDVPTLAAIGNEVMDEDTTRVVNLTGLTSGAPNELQTLTVTATSDNPTVLPNSALTYTETGPGTGTLTIDPPNDQFSATPITVTVTVNDGQAANNLFSRVFTVTVTGVNDPPTFTAGLGQTASDEGGQQVIAGWASNVSAGPNEAGQTLTFTATPNDPSLFTGPITIDSNGQLTFRPAPNPPIPESGASFVATVSVTLFDGVTTSAAQPFTITVTKPHRMFNVRNTRDVNDSREPVGPGNPTGSVSGLDALIIFNAINAFPASLPPGVIDAGGQMQIRADAAVPGPGALNPGTPLVDPPFFYDTNGDNFITGLDALVVINFLNSGGLLGGGEGESADSFMADEAAVSEDGDDLADILALLAADAAEASQRRRGS